MMPTSLDPELETRLEALESRLAHQDDWLDTLDRTVITQQRQIESLERLNALMATQLRSLREPVNEGVQRESEDHTPLQDELPPHY
ncbi:MULTISPECIES: SlyX family protein [Cobetia]|uniref:SlyX family protein n=1 Tax=Cobetia crustatorum TaxID=553385 RepID=A0A558HGU7_9GAMM|nr:MULTISPECIES: SlyX family protein [Cobetia]TVU68334.1 SlyX family protein [Cobetia crustatorum]